MEKPHILEISRPFLTSNEISHLHSLTIPEDRKILYNQRKYQIFQYISHIVKILKFPLRVLNTTMIYYQKYYLFNVFEDESEDFTDLEKNMENDPYLISITCLFLASKNEDCIKKLRDIQTVSNKLRDLNEDMNYLELQKKVILAIEYKLLQVLKFNFNNNLLNLPSLDNLVLQFSKKLELNYSNSYFGWLIAFDLMLTPIGLTIPPHCIALAILIVTLHLEVDDLKLKYKEYDNEIDNGSLIEKINYQDFHCPESLVNETVIYILGFYIHQYNFSVLTQFLPAINKKLGKEQIFKFMNLKSKLIHLKGANETSTSKQLLSQDRYLNIWDYSNSAKGSSRFILSSKRRRFDKELETNFKK